MQKVLAFVCLLFAVTFAVNLDNDQEAFLNFMHRFNKSYSTDEFPYRLATFKKNLQFINEYNARNTGVILKLNQFADLSNEEFKRIYLGFRPSKSSKIGGEPFVADPAVHFPASKDWRQAGAVTGVKNQEQCGSCWAFSTTGSVEGCHFLGVKTLTSLSEKNLMDCSWSQGNMACNGGLMTSAMDYIISNQGIDTEASYPYVAVSSHQCKYKAASKGSTLASYKNVQQGSESDLQNAVNTAPTSVAIDASHNSFQFYSSGVYYEPDCSSDQLDHGVLAIGWGTDSGQDYWLVKNSWGTEWGDSGYIKMSRNRNNNCGIATMATLPSGCH